MLSLIYVFKTGKLIAYEGDAGEVIKEEELNIPDVNGLILDYLRGQVWLFKDRVEIFTDFDTIEDFKKWTEIDKKK